MILETAAIICSLVTYDVTMSYTHGRPSGFVRRCKYECSDTGKQTHWYPEKNQCPTKILKPARGLYFG